MNELNHLLPPALMRAAGFTLLHSLWQGALVALAASVLLMLLHRHRAELRYRVVAGALALVVALAALTFANYYSAGLNPAADLSAVSLPTDGTPSLAAGNGAPAAPSLDFSGRVDKLLAAGTGYVDHNLPLIVSAWLLGMLAMTLRFLGGLAYVQRLRRYRVAALPLAWQSRLDELAARAGLTQRVQLLASALVPSPVVVGYFKPVILLPLGAATGLSMAELEMILAHEVAHVLRKDYLFNLLQSVAEILFFYHPAVWFLSASLRTERENCCDDLATELCGDSRRLAEALSSLAELTYAAGRTPQLAMAATGPGGPGSLLGRVRRLVAHRPSAPTFLEGFWAACVVLVSAGLLAGSTLASLEASASPSALLPAGQPPIRLDSAAGTDSILVFTTPQTKVADLNIGGKKVGPAQPQPLAAASSGLQQDPTPEVTAQKRKKKTATRVTTATTSSTSTMTTSGSQSADPQERIEAEMRKDGLLRNRNQFDYTLKASSLVVDGQVQPAAVAAKYRHLYEAETGRKLGPTSSYRNTRTHDEDGQAPAAPKASSIHVHQETLAPTPPAPPLTPSMPASSSSSSSSSSSTSTVSSPDNAAITQELIQDGLIAPNAKSYQFELTKNGLVVNGQAQPEAKAAKYRRLLNVPADQPGNRTSSVRIIVNE
jgi:beta-lactamase regulating signal transducer with metallopeptidase domain